MARANDKVYIVNSLLMFCSLPYFPRCFRVEFFFVLHSENTLFFSLCFRSNRFLIFYQCTWSACGSEVTKRREYDLRASKASVFFLRALQFVWKKQYFCASGLSFLRFRKIPSTFWASCAIFQGIAWFYTTWWVALHSVCAFRGVCITQPLPNLGRRALERNFKDFPRWDTKFEPLSWFIVDILCGQKSLPVVCVLLFLCWYVMQAILSHSS